MQGLRLFAAAFALLLLTQGAVSQSVQLNAENLRNLALFTLEQGDVASALDMADALLLADPHDPVALVVRSRALRNLGQTDAAISSAVAAWQFAPTPHLRFAAALARAQALASDGQRLRAQWWLRRATELAPDDRGRALAQRDFEYVRSRTPLRLRFDFSLRPTSNLNNGSSQTTLTIPGLPFVFDIDGAGQALSGYRATLGASGRYRLDTTAQAETDLTFAVTQQVSLLSGAARRQAPAVRGRDFDFAAIEAGLSYRRAATAATQLTASLTFGTNRYGGAALSNYVRVGLASTTALSQATQVDLAFSAEDQHRQDAALNSALILTASGVVKHSFSNRDQLHVGLTLRDTQSAAGPVDHGAVTASLTYALARPVLGMAISATVDVGTKTYARSAFSATGRDDLKLGLSVDATLRNLDYLGFAPVISLNISETQSNISLYDTRDASVGFSIISTF
jgi:tetratricopeptide (TPR) repeat protein